LLVNHLITILLSTGTFYLFSIAGLIGKIVQFPWMDDFVQHSSLIFPIGVMILMYEIIITEISIKESLKDKNSALHFLSHRRVWAPIVIYASILTSVIFFGISINESLIDVYGEEGAWYPGGLMALYYLLGLFAPIPRILIFNPTLLKKFLSSRYDQELTKINQ